MMKTTMRVQTAVVKVDLKYRSSAVPLPNHQQWHEACLSHPIPKGAMEDVIVLIVLMRASVSFVCNHVIYDCSAYVVFVSRPYPTLLSQCSR